MIFRPKILLLMSTLSAVALGSDDSMRNVGKKATKDGTGKKGSSHARSKEISHPTHGPSHAACDEGFPTVSPLDLARYAGRWYLIYATDSPQIQKRCSAANYVYIPPNPMFGGPPRVDVINSAYCSPGELCSPPYGVYYDIPGVGIPNPGFPTEPGKLLVTLQTGPPPGIPVTFNYWVIDVVDDPEDETAPYQFAATADPYYPTGALTYVLSRKPTIEPGDEDTVAMLLGKVESAGIPLENLVPIIQEPSCVYEQ